MLQIMPAHAQWVPYESTNTLPNVPGSNEGASPNVATPSPSFVTEGSDTLLVTAFGAPILPAPANITGTVTFTFKWDGVAGQTVTPLYVLLQANASAHGMEMTDTPVVSDGLGNPTIPGPADGCPWVLNESSSGSTVIEISAPPNAGPGTLLSLNPYTQTATGSHGDVDTSMSATAVDPGSLDGYSTVDNANWDPTNPRFFSGTNCSVIAKAKAISGYITSAQLFIGGAVVKSYFDTSIVPSPTPANTTTGSNQTTASLSCYFDSTHFSDETNIPIQMWIHDSSGDRYSISISGPAVNNAYVLYNSTSSVDDNQGVNQAQPAADDVTALLGPANIGELASMTAILRSNPFNNLAIDHYWSIEWKRSFHGIPYRGQGVSVGVDAQTGAITLVEIVFTSPPITQAVLNITEQQAIAITQEHMIYDMGFQGVATLYQAKLEIVQPNSGWSRFQDAPGHSWTARPAWVVKYTYPLPDGRGAEEDTWVDTQTGTLLGHISGSGPMGGSTSATKSQPRLLLNLSQQKIKTVYLRVADAKAKHGWRPLKAASFTLKKQPQLISLLKKSTASPAGTSPAKTNIQFALVSKDNSISIYDYDPSTGRLGAGKYWVIVPAKLKEWLQRTITMPIQTE